MSDNLREQAQKHPVIARLGLVATVALAVFGVTSWYADQASKSTVGTLEQRLTLAEQQKQDQARQADQEKLAQAVRNEAVVAEIRAQLAEKDQQLAGIQRGLSGKSFLDAATLTTTTAEAGSVVGPKAALYEGEGGGGFYALSAAAAAPWRYEVVTELQLLLEMFNVREDELVAQGVDRQVVTRIPVHRWLAPETPAIEGIDLIKAVPTQVYVQRIAADDLRQSLGPAAVPSSPDPASSDLLDERYRGDLAIDPADHPVCFRGCLDRNRDARPPGGAQGGQRGLHASRE